MAAFDLAFSGLYYAVRWLPGTVFSPDLADSDYACAFVQDMVDASHLFSVLSGSHSYVELLWYRSMLGWTSLRVWNVSEVDVDS